MAQPIKQDDILNDSNNYYFIDVRDPFDYETYHIPNAMSLPLNVIENEIVSLIGNKSQRIVIYCENGRKSKMACTLLEQLGYTSVFDFGAIKNWDKKADKKLIKKTRKILDI